MASLIDLLDKIWHTPNRQMAWGRIPSNHVIGAKAAAAFVPNDDYFVVRLGSMFLKDSRVLWLKLSPLAHALITSKGRSALKSETAVIGPAQFGDLASAPAARSVILNQRLAGPTVFRGGDIDIAAGLFAVPKDRAATVLLDTVGKLSALAVPGLAQTLELAQVVKAGVEGLIGLDGTKPVLGVKDALMGAASANAGQEAAPCVLVAIAAPAAEVDFNTLWVREGRLLQGKSADSLQFYEASDHLLVTIERGAPRQDWRGLPELTPHESTFDGILRAEVAKADAIQQLNAAFSAFDADLTSEEELTDADKARIRGEVVAELKARLERKYAGIFGAETRSIGGIARKAFDLSGFNFLDVGDSKLEGAAPLKPGALPF
jgi:hypothetical protein